MEVCEPAMGEDDAMRVEEAQYVLVGGPGDVEVDIQVQPAIWHESALVAESVQDLLVLGTQWRLEPLEDNDQVMVDPS